MMLTRWLLLASLVLLSCGAPARRAPAPRAQSAQPPARQAAPPARQAPRPAPPLAEDTPAVAVGPATFTAPAGWSLQRERGRALLEAPEGDCRVAIVAVQAGDADAAQAAAWASLDADPARPIRLRARLAPHGGWRERIRFAYETPPNERRAVYAQLHRDNGEWVVLAVDGSRQTQQKRLSQLNIIEETLHPAAYERESFAGATAHPLDRERIARIRQFVAESMAKLGVPGAAVALLDRGKIVFAGGVGVRELGKSKPVDADTRFLIASNTKALTTLMLAKLVDEGKLAWDTPVTDIYRDFALGDAETTRQVLVKHLLCACTGLPRQDYEWVFEFEKATPKAQLAVLATMQPTTRFGELYQYSNPLASAAGYIGGHRLYPERELGAAYDEAMRTRVFAPLGMTRATFDMDQGQRGNHARPHSDNIDGEPTVANMALNRAVVPLRPAGGAWASANDIARYLQMELGRGKLANGKQYISQENLLARRAKQVLVGENHFYGMGLHVDTTLGITVVHHGGSLFGYKSDMIFLPDHGVGAVILTNADSGRLLLAPFRRYLLEILFDGRPEAVAELDAKAEERRARAAAERARLEVPAAAELAAQLASGYRNPALGEIHVVRQGGRTRFDMGEWSSEVASRTNEDGSASFVTIDPGYDGFEFVVREEPGQRGLVLRDAQHEYVFAPQP